MSDEKHKEKRKLSSSVDLSGYQWIPTQWAKPLTQKQWTVLLVEAAKKGDIERARICLENGADINGIARISRDEEIEYSIGFYEIDGQTALHMSAHSWKARGMVEFLLAPPSASSLRKFGTFSIRPSKVAPSAPPKSQQIDSEDTTTDGFDLTIP